MTLLVGCGAREARSQVLELADVLAAPMVLTLKAKEGLEHDNPFEVGQSGLIGNPAAAKAMDDCDVLVLVGTDFPYRDWYPTGKTVIQLDARGEHVGRRTPVQHALVGDAAATLERLVPRLERRDGPRPPRDGRDGIPAVARSAAVAPRPGPRPDAPRAGPRRPRQPRRADPPRGGGSGRRPPRAGLDDLHERHRHVDRVARALRHDARHAAAVGSYNLGSMANAMPMALGAQALDRTRPSSPSPATAD